MNMIFNQGQVRTVSPGMIAIPLGFVTTTGGTIGSTQNYGGGASIAKTGATTGRYTITIIPPTGITIGNLVFFGGLVDIHGPDTAALAAGKGTKAVWRRDDISNVALRGSSAKDGTIELQFTRNNSTTDDNDTELEDGAAVSIVLFLGLIDVV